MIWPEEITEFRRPPEISCEFSGLIVYPKNLRLFDRAVNRQFFSGEMQDIRERRRSVDRRAMLGRIDAAGRYRP